MPETEWEAIAACTKDVALPDEVKGAAHASMQALATLVLSAATRQELVLVTRQVERLLAEQALRVATINRDLEAFNYSTAHELRTPLARISHLARLLQQRYCSTFPPDVQDYLDRIWKSSQHMSQLIEALLELSQLSYQSLKREMVDLSEIAQATAHELRQGTPERRAQFLIQPHIRTLGDVRLLEIVMKNLLRNAWKFTRMRNTACIEFGARELAGHKTCFVRDNGIGFEMTNAERMFLAFQRLHNSSDYPGYGIGLTTVQRIINRHGGKIWAEGEVGKGATFYFTLTWCMT
ncbi:MAG TPA: ATP-binding protein [Geomonas sp.]|nr:ATP-binding protein [Geomonas sp.]